MILLLQDAINNSEVSAVTKFFYNDYIVEIFGGVVLSLMGLFLVWFLRPKIKFAPHIAMEGEGDNYEFLFKVINRSFLFQLVDIHFELTMLKPVTTPKGMNIAIDHVPLKANHVWFLSRRKWNKKKQSSNDYATYAIVLTVDKEFDLLKKWKQHAKDGTYFDLKVIAKNNFSGITSINHEKYSHSSCIKKGSFCHGNSMEIENSS